MSPKEKIAKLEALLARVKERAERPRTNGAAVFPAPSAHTAQQPARSAQIHVPAVSAPKAIASLPPELSSGWSDLPPPTSRDGSSDSDASPEAIVGTDDSDVEVSSDVVEVDIDVDELEMAPAGERSPPAMPAESGPQPIADHVEPPDTMLEEVSDELVLAVTSAPPTATSDHPVFPANEILEPAPSSSPRPIAEAEPAYEAESAPRHTPPPESGKQVASPSVKPEPRSPSAPPSSLEGRTLIGGWREPGVFAPRVPGRGVRVPAPVRPEAPIEALPKRSPGGEPERSAPQVVEARMPDRASVAAFEGAPPVVAPATFGDLLDATLAL